MLSVDRPSTECQPITGRYIGQVSTNYRPTIGEVSAKCRRSVGERKAISAETHLERLSTVSRPSVDPLSTDYRPLYRPTVDRVSTDSECRLTSDRLSTECQPLYRPLYRPISRSTLPTVNKIRYFSGNKMIQNESQFDCVRKKDNSKKKNIFTKLSKHLPLESYSQAVSIHLQLFVYHVSGCKYQLSTPPNLIFVLFL